MNIHRITNTLIRHEGSKKKGNRHIPYVDTVGKTTIGYGRNLTDRGISESEAKYLLQNDIQDHLNELRNALPWFAVLDEVRQEVFVDLAFNLGVPTLMKFRTMLSNAEEGNWKSAAMSLLDSKYALQVGRRATENARALETGEWS